jgi:hypothetical protein
MSEENTATPLAETEQQQPASMTMAAFLTAMPPSDKFTLVNDVLFLDRDTYQIVVPGILLHCTSEICKDGNRVYRYLKGHRYLGNESPTLTYLTYICSNCRQQTKMFSLALRRDEIDPPAALCAKFGEIPEFGSPTPNRLLRLFGSDSRIFLKGRQCENHGLGIGAFSYY